MLYCIEKIANVLVVITGAKRRKELLKKIYLDASQKDTVELIYSTLISWFEKNDWFNSINIEKLNGNIRNDDFTEYSPQCRAESGLCPV